MTRSGSDRSGSSPRVAASNVARETPSCCACGHSDWMNVSNAGSAKATWTGTPAASSRLASARTMLLLVVRLLGGGIAVLADLLHVGDADRRDDEYDVDDGLPLHAFNRVMAGFLAELAGVDENAQQVNRRDADDR